MDKLFDELKVDGVLVTSPYNMRYVSGFSGGEGAILITPSKKYIFVDGRYTIQAKQQTNGFTVVEFKKGLFSELAEFTFNAIGIEEDFVTFSFYQKLKDVFKNCEFKGISSYLETKRSVKTDEEIMYIKKAEETGDKAFSYILGLIKEGVTEKELAAEIEHFMKKSGADGIAFDTIVAFGERCALPHAYPTDRKLKRNEFVLFDYGCTVNGYCGDMTRTVYFGKATKEEKEVYNLVLKAQTKSLSKIKSGVKCSEVHNVAVDVLKTKGIDRYFTHSLGHGAGLKIHESPNLSPKSTVILQENMVVSVEPGVYFENRYGIRIEDLVSVTKDGYCNFTKSDKSFIEIN